MWLTLKKIQLQNYKNYTACPETLGWAINRPCHLWKILFAQAIYRRRTTYLLKGLQYCLDGASQQKLFTWRKINPSRWDLFYVEVISHLVGMNQFSYKQYVFTKRNIPFCQDLTQVRHLTWDDFSHINSSQLNTYEQIIFISVELSFQFSAE